MPEPSDQPPPRSASFRGADTPALVMKTAMQSFGFNCFLWDAVGQERICSDTFRDEIRIEVEGGRGLALRRGKFTKDELVRLAHNNLLMAFGTTSLATDEAMESLFGKVNAGDTSEFGSARAIINQIRNAFAHGPLNPVWRPRPLEKWEHTYSITVQVPQASGVVSRRIELHPPTLNDKHLSADDFGGLGGYMRLLEYCWTKVESHPRGNQAYVPPVEP